MYFFINTQVNATTDYILVLDPNSMFYDEGQCLDNLTITGNITQL